MVLVRHEIGDVLRDFRQRKGHTLRFVAARASVALGYLSEVERGQKEASSEILASVAEALDTPLSVIMREVSDRLALSEGIRIPDTVPADFMVEFEQSKAIDEATFIANAGFSGEASSNFEANGDSSLASRG